MFNINFDLFYELKQGSTISNINKKVLKYWRLVDGILEVKTVTNKQIEYDWHATDLFIFPVDGKFNIEERFERFSNG